MTVLLPFVINSGLNFALGLLIAYFLGPAEFGRYAIGAALIVLLNTALLDWIRLSAVRFYSLKTRETQPACYDPDRSDRRRIAGSRFLLSCAARIESAPGTRDGRGEPARPDRHAP